MMMVKNTFLFGSGFAMNVSFILVTTYRWNYIWILHIHSVSFHMDCTAYLARLFTK